MTFQPVIPDACAAGEREPIVLPAGLDSRLRGNDRVAAFRSFATDLIRYFGVSAAALGVDYASLIFLHRVADLHYLVAATIAFLAGLAVAWSLSVAVVFAGRRRLSPWREFGGFLATGLAGLVLTQLALAALVGGVGIAPELAKIPVAGGVFLFNFLSRRLLFLAPAA